MRRTLVVALGIPLVTGVAVGLSFAWDQAGPVVGIVGAVIIVWAWFAVGRNFRSWGYVERADDLLVTHGALFKKLTVVPYGRMQLVDVKAGPIERSFGLVASSCTPPPPPATPRCVGSPLMRLGPFGTG